MQNNEMSMLQHLEELRRVLIISIVSVFLMAVGCWFFSDAALKILMQPLAGTDSQMVYIGVTEAVMTRLKLAFFMGGLVALPLILWQLWGFIIPALRKMERIHFTLFIIISYLLFLGGVAFGFLVVFKFCVNFLLRYGSPELIPMLSIGKYISFTLNFLLPFGLIFEMPLASYFLAKIGVISYHTMVKGRKMAIVVAVVIAAAVVTSPDIFSVLLMASPIYLLYEFSAAIVGLVEWLRKRQEAGKKFSPAATLKQLWQKIKKANK